MGTKLISFLLLGMLFFSCTRKGRHSDFHIKEEDYIKAYKTTVMCGCLNEGTKGNFNKFLEDNNDLGLFSEVDMIFHATANIADSLGRVYARKIKPFTYGDGAGKVPNFSRCYFFSISNEVDSAAKASYRQELNAD